MRTRRSDRSARPRPWSSDRSRSRREWRSFRFSYRDLFLRNNERAHLAHDLFDVARCGPETRDTRPYHRHAVAEADFRHPRDLALVEIGQESAGDETVAREAHQRQRRVVD